MASRSPIKLLLNICQRVSCYLQDMMISSKPSMPYWLEQLDIAQKIYNRRRLLAQCGQLRMENTRSLVIYSFAVSWINGLTSKWKAPGDPIASPARPFTPCLIERWKYCPVLCAA